MSEDSVLPQSAHLIPTSRLIPLTEWPKYHAWPPLGGLRHLAFYSKTNGFDKVLKRCGRKVLIDEQKFFEFVDEKNQIANKQMGAR